MGVGGCSSSDFAYTNQIFFKIISMYFMNLIRIAEYESVFKNGFTYI